MGYRWEEPVTGTNTYISKKVNRKPGVKPQYLWYLKYDEDHIGGGKCTYLIRNAGVTI